MRKMACDAGVLVSIQRKFRAVSWFTTGKDFSAASDSLAK